MDNILEKLFPYEGIPEIMLEFLDPFERHEKSSENYRKILIKKYTKCLIEPDSVAYVFNCVPHRFDDDPALIHMCGDICWYYKGQLHREGDKPAFINSRQKIKAWFYHGKLHREGGKPAVIRGIGTPKKEWWINDERQATE